MKDVPFCCVACHVAERGDGARGLLSQSSYTASTYDDYYLKCLN